MSSTKANKKNFTPHTVKNITAHDFHEAHHSQISMHTEGFHVFLVYFAINKISLCPVSLCHMGVPVDKPQRNDLVLFCADNE